MKLWAKYETDDRLHIRITDADNERYEIPEDVLPSPPDSSSSTPNILFKYTESPFSFAVIRNDTEEVLFELDGPLVYEQQFFRLRTQLPNEPNIYGLGEHTDGLRM